MRGFPSDPEGVQEKETRWGDAIYWKHEPLAGDMSRGELLSIPPDPEGGAWWACGESYRGSGRPSRLWEEWTASANERPDDGNPYPFNGMGGAVLAGPFATRQDAAQYCVDAVYDDSEGFMQWA